MDEACSQSGMSWFEIAFGLPLVAMLWLMVVGLLIVGWRIFVSPGIGKDGLR